MRRIAFVVVLAALTVLQPSLAGAQGAAIGSGGADENQPRPGIVVPRERRDGVAAPPGQAAANGRTLDQLDKSLLRSEGASTASVPKFNGGTARPAAR